jgi:hypothetical protein
LGTNTSISQPPVVNSHGDADAHRLFTAEEAMRFATDEWRRSGEDRGDPISIERTTNNWFLIEFPRGPKGELRLGLWNPEYRRSSAYLSWLSAKEGAAVYAARDILPSKGLGWNWGWPSYVRTTSNGWIRLVYPLVPPPADPGDKIRIILLSPELDRIEIIK